MRSLVVAALFLWGCEDPIVTKIDPILEVRPDHIDFGTVEITQQKVEIAYLKNLENVPAVILKAEIDQPDFCNENCFRVQNRPDVVGPLVEWKLEVRFRPIRLEAVTATLTIQSDDPKAPEHKVSLIGRGIDSRKPCIEAIPQMVDFGFVPSGGIAVRSFSVRNCGDAKLYIDRASIDPLEAPFKITTSTPTPEMPGELEPGAHASVGLRTEVPKTVSGTVTGSVLFETNVLTEVNVPGKPGQLRVPLKAIGNLPPVAVCGEDQTIEPWSRVSFDGTMSRDQDNPPNDPLSYLWTLVSKPGGSTAELERATSPMPSFWADLTGTYEVQLVVLDSLGLESEPVTCVVEALPTNAVRIELTWDHPDSDVDLHLMQENGTFCDCATDTHYRDCGREPNWFPNTPGANPRLDIDDRSGFGPENINIDGDGPDRFIPDGRYLIRVHYFASNKEVSTWPTSTSNATVRVFVYGLLAGELSMPLLNDKDLWLAGTLEWPSGNIVPEGTIIAGALCGVF